MAKTLTAAGTVQQVRLLGPVAIRIGDVEHPIVGVRRSAVLAALALSAGFNVSTHTLIEVVWSGDAPATAANTLQRHVSHLRGLFSSRDTIVAAAPGYRLELGKDATDLMVAQRFLAQAASAHGPREKAAALRNALGQWHCGALADLAELAWFSGQAARIEKLRAGASSALIDARLDLGEHAALVPELEQLVRENPFDETAHAQLMLALYRCGRQADALTVYRGVHTRLSEELGVDPGPALRDLQMALLRQDPALSAPRPPIAVQAPAPVGPAHLPPALPHLIGREAELELLDEARLSGKDGLTVVVSGPPGVGKTSIAVAWARAIAADFPDGQLYVNLRGFGPQAAVPPAEALQGFLEALGVPPQRIPETVEARSGLFRSLLTGKRMLVLLDNAHDAEHVRPLLSGAPQSLTLITSRNRLTPLVVTEAAVTIPLEVLSRAAAHDLLVQRLGRKRVATEPDVVDDLISRCAGLPLALAIVASRAATEPALALATFHSQMLATAGVLDTLSGGDHSTDIRTVISWSYAVLSPEAARLFRLLTLHPAADIGVRAASSLAGLPIGQTRRLLAELTTANLLLAQGDERYTFHDLIRAFAVEQEQDGQDEALTRLLDHYLHTGHTAAMLLAPKRVPIAIMPPRAGVTAESPATYDEAMAWFAAESTALHALVQCAHAQGADTHAWQLAWTMTTFHYRRGYWDEEFAVHRIALASGERTGDRLAQAHALRGMAFVESARGRLKDAAERLRAAIGLFAATGQRAEQARANLNLCGVLDRDERWAEAVVTAEHSLELYRELDDDWGVASAQNSLGFYLARLGRYTEALEHLRVALPLMEGAEDWDSLAAVWDSLGYVHHRLGEHGKAAEAYERAVAIFAEQGNRSQEALALNSLGDVYNALGEPDQAQWAWTAALAVLEDLRHVQADAVRVKLTAGSRARG